VEGHRSVGQVAIGTVQVTILFYLHTTRENIIIFVSPLFPLNTHHIYNYYQVQQTNMMMSTPTASNNKRKQDLFHEDYPVLHPRNSNNRFAYPTLPGFAHRQGSSEQWMTKKKGHSIGIKNDPSPPSTIPYLPTFASLSDNDDSTRGRTTTTQSDYGQFVWLDVPAAMSESLPEERITFQRRREDPRSLLGERIFHFSFHDDEQVGALRPLPLLPTVLSSSSNDTSIQPLAKRIKMRPSSGQFANVLFR